MTTQIQNKASLNEHRSILTESIYLKTSLLIQLVIVRKMVSARTKLKTLALREDLQVAFFLQVAL